MPIPFNIIVAVDREFGIGKKGVLPWHLPGELKHFKDITITTAAAQKQNALIMGRKTWDSLPPPFQPLPKRINMVLTRRSDVPLPPGVGRAAGLDEALDRLVRDFQEKLDQVFVIGGAQVFQEALKSEHCRKIYLTRLDQVFGCDVFFPQDLSAFQLTFESGVLTESGVSYQFQEYARRQLGR